MHRPPLHALCLMTLLLMLAVIPLCLSPCPMGRLQCGGICYEPTAGTCRNGTVVPLPIWDSCNGTPYDRGSQSCCGGIIEEATRCRPSVIGLPSSGSGIVPAVPGTTPSLPTPIPKSTPEFLTITPVRACDATEYLTNPHCTEPPTPVRACGAEEYLTNPLCPPPAQAIGTPVVSRANESAWNTTYSAAGGSSHTAQATNSTG